MAASGLLTRSACGGLCRGGSSGGITRRVIGYPGLVVQQQGQAKADPENDAQMFSWYGVDPAFIEGVATEDSSGRERQSLQRAMSFNCLTGIAGATGVKTAALAQMWTNDSLIPS